MTVELAVIELRDFLKRCRDAGISIIVDAVGEPFIYDIADTELPPREVINDRNRVVIKA